MNLPVACPVCGPSSARPWRWGRPFRVVRCVGCGLGITWPPPSDADLTRYYEDGYYDRDGMGADTVAGWPARAAAVLRRIPVSVERVLDIGAGQGHLVAALRALGVAADGVEPLASGRRVARELHGVELLEAWPDATASGYDLVTLIHSLEHVRDPRAVLQAAGARVRAGGFLFVDVPHAATFELWRPSRRREVLALPGHLYHFTPEPLARLIVQAGWRVKAVHLTNPDLLEWLFAQRARLSTGAKTTGAASNIRPPGSDLDDPACAPPRGLKRLWRGALPRLRARFPGYRFEVVAQRGESA